MKSEKKNWMKSLFAYASGEKKRLALSVLLSVLELLPPQAVIVSAMAPAISAASNLFFMENPSLFKFCIKRNLSVLLLQHFSSEKSISQVNARIFLL